MPTTDPIKRRKQNCENQKRWRERQTTNLHRLSAELDQRNDQIAQLEKDNKRLRDQLDAANAQIHQLNQLNQTLNLSSQASLVTSESSTPQLSIPPELAFPARSSTLKRSTTSGTERLNSPSLASSSSASHDTVDLTESSLSFIPQSNPHLSQQYATYPINHRNHDFASNLEPSSIPGMVQAISDLGTTIFSQSDHTSALYHASNFPIPHSVSSNTDDSITLLEMLRECLKVLVTPEEENRFECDTRLLHIDSSTYDLLGSGLGVGRLMMTFHDTTRISKHIFAVQSVLHESLPLLKAQPHEFKNHVLSEAFSWMIREAWPSSEKVFKFMTVYQHIRSFELFRNFPCKTTYRQIHPFYRPTIWQLLIPHSPAIDWLPWPEMRNKLILLSKTTKIDVDEICMRALENTIVEPEFAWHGLVQATSTFRIWDMYLMERAEGGTFSDSVATYNLSSPNLRKLIRSYNLAPQDISQYRLDRPFCDQFPDVATPGCQSTFETYRFNVPNLDKLEYPTDMKSDSVQRLRDMVQRMISGHV